MSSAVDDEYPAIYQNGEFYDWLARFTAPDDLPFYRQLRRQFPGPLLELGCGTGRVCLALAAEGGEVSGVDRSAALLQRARQKSAPLATPPSLYQADLREFDLGARFDLLLLPYNTFNHLLSLDEIRRALACIRRHMHAGSRLAIDTFNPDLQVLAAEHRQEHALVRFPQQGKGNWVTLYETATYDSVRQIYDCRWRYCDESSTDFATDRIRMRVFFPQELDALLALQGFEIEARYGDYECGRFSAQSAKQLLICRLVEPSRQPG